MNKQRIGIGIFTSLLVISLILYGVGSFTFLESLRIVFGSVFVLFVPGFVLTWMFFPSERENSIDWLERIALSFALSIAVVPLVVFYLNLVGVKINLLNSFLSVLGIILISLGILVWKNRFKK